MVLTDVSADTKETDPFAMATSVDTEVSTALSQLLSSLMMIFPYVTALSIMLESPAGRRS